MIRMLTAHTREIDDIEMSVAEIVGQLNLEGRLLHNSIGILIFHSEFLETGVVKAVSEALPFNSSGGTTSNMAVAGSMGDLMLAVTVLTSDDVEFRSGCSGPIKDDDDPLMPVRELYARLTPSSERPSMLFTFAPVIAGVGCDDFVEALDAVSGEVPLFGSLAITPLPDFSGIEICANGERHTDALTLIAMFGDVRPEFYLASIPDERIIRKSATITSAVKNRIQSINGIAPLEYLESVGLAENGSIAGIGVIPFVLTLGDGSQVVRSAYKMTDEGYILSFGNTPEGARIGFASCDAKFVVKSTGEVIAQAVVASRAENALIFSCGGRRGTLGMKMEKEMKEVARRLGDSFAYQFAYSGGEICPTTNRDGRWVNRFHNFSMAACLL
jgi:hypothetical protein